MPCNWSSSSAGPHTPCTQAAVSVQSASKPFKTTLRPCSQALKRTPVRKMHASSMGSTPTTPGGGATAQSPWHKPARTPLAMPARRRLLHPDAVQSEQCWHPTQSTATAANGSCTPACAQQAAAQRVPCAYCGCNAVRTAHQHLMHHAPPAGARCSRPPQCLRASWVAHAHMRHNSAVPAAATHAQGPTPGKQPAAPVVPARSTSHVVKLCSDHHSLTTPRPCAATAQCLCCRGCMHTGTRPLPPTCWCGTQAPCCWHC